jgi:diacylglycerol kinase (ATP)
VPAKLVPGRRGPADRRTLRDRGHRAQALPFGLKPFGAPREGLKLLDVDAPPRRLLKALPMVLSGKDDPRS